MCSGLQEVFLDLPGWVVNVEVSETSLCKNSRRLVILLAFAYEHWHRDVYTKVLKN